MGDIDDILNAIPNTPDAVDIVAIKRIVDFVREIRRHRLAEAAACQRLIDDLQLAIMRYNQDESFDDRGAPRFRVK